MDAVTKTARNKRGKVFAFMGHLISHWGKHNIEVATGLRAESGLWEVRKGDMTAWRPSPLGYRMEDQPQEAGCHVNGWHYDCSSPTVHRRQNV